MKCHTGIDAESGFTHKGASANCNVITWLDGSCARREAGTGRSRMAPKLTAYDQAIHEKVDTTQEPQHAPANQKAEWAMLKTVLSEEIVPRAVTALLALFPETFGYLDGSSIGIGLSVYENESFSELASVLMTTTHSGGTPPVVGFSYSLRVNAPFLSLDAENHDNLTPAGRANLRILNARFFTWMFVNRFRF